MNKIVKSAIAAVGGFIGGLLGFLVIGWPALIIIFIAILSLPLFLSKKEKEEVHTKVQEKMQTIREANCDFRGYVNSKDCKVFDSNDNHPLKYCEYCNSANNALEEKCVVCGAPFSKATERGATR